MTTQTISRTAHNEAGVFAANSALYRDVPALAARGEAAAELRALIEAAGPLSLRNIAGGLNLPRRLVARLVRRNVDAGQLRPDEWGRYALAGSWCEL